MRRLFRIEVNQIKIQLKNVSHSYGDHKVIDGVSLDIEKGELMALLGPSGCGKTTILRLVAGLLAVEEGEIFFNEKEVKLWSPQKRNTAMVFQSYALFPHMTVEENIEYGLRVRKKSKQVRKESVQRIMEKVQLLGLGQRMIQELSGGQQQRVALARALIIEPDVLLFDEPLSNLDEKLRVSMRQEIRAIQKDLGITGIYVTHDQEEAMAIADRIIIMKDGKIQQIGNPKDVYEKPVNRFVASFMGECNLFENEGGISMCRPDTINLSPEGSEEGIVTWIEYLGSIQRVKLAWNGRELVVEVFSKQFRDYHFEVGDVVRFDFNTDEHRQIQF